MSRSYQRKESSIVLSEKRNVNGSDADKRKSLNLAISNYFRQKERSEDQDKFRDNFQLYAQSPFAGDHAKRSVADDEFTYNGQNQENTIIGKLYDIMRRLKIKQFALQLLNSTPSRMLKKMSAEQFSLINDKAQDFSDLQKNSQKFVLNLSSKSSLLIFVINAAKSCNSYPVINPANKYKLVWDIFISLTLVYAFFFIPIMVSFSISESEVSYNNILSILLVVLIIDICINCNTGFYKRGVLCKKREKILNKYFQEQFRIDFISLFPILLYKFIFLTFFSSYDYESILLLILIKWKKLSKLYNEIQYKYILRPNIRNILSLMRLFIIILLIAHSCACIWIVIGRLSKFYYGNDNWIYLYVKDSSWDKVYLYAFYFCTVTMTTVGYGDISPKSPLEFIACTIMVLISAGIFGFSINTISDILQDFSKNERIIMEKMFIIKKYLLKKSISPDLSKDVSEYLEYCWRQNIESCLDEEDKMIKQLSDQLRNDLLIESNKIILKESSIFQNNFSEDVMKSIVSIIQEKNYTPQEIIFTKGDQNPNRSIYFVQEGIVELFMQTSNNFTKGQNLHKSIKRLKKGDFFGEIEFFTDSDRLENVRSVNFSKILKIDRSDFIRMIKNYPQDYEQYCYIKERLINSHDYQKIFKKCNSCNSENHTLEKCPYVNYIANKPKIIAMHNRPGCEQHQNNINEGNLLQSRTQNRSLQFNAEELQTVTEQFQEINEEFLEEYTKNYLSFDISKCDICSNQSFNNQAQTQGNAATTLETTSQFQNNYNPQQLPNFNNVNQIPSNNTASSNYNHSSKKTMNSFNIMEEEKIQQKISLHKRAYLKSSMKSNTSNNKSMVSVITDEFEGFETISPLKAVKNLKSSMKIRKKKNSESKMSKQPFQNHNQQDGSSIFIKSNTEVLDQGSPYMHHQSSYNITNSQQSINAQSNHLIAHSNQDHVMQRYNPNTSIIECMQDAMNTSSINPHYQFRLSGQQQNHQQIIFFDLFQGQLDRMQNYLLYYPLNNYSFVIQQLQMDSAQKKKMKNKLIQQQRAAILKLISKNKSSNKMTMAQNSLNQSSSNFQQMKRAFDKMELDFKDRDLKSYKGQTIQSLNHNNSHYQMQYSASELKKNSIRESFSNAYEEKSFRFANKVEEVNENEMISSQKLNIPLSANASKQNILSKDNNGEFQSFQEISQIDVKKVNKSELKNAFQELSTFQQTTTFNQEKTKSDKLLNFQTVNTIPLNQSHDQQYIKSQIGDLSPPLRENRVCNYKQFEIQNSISAYFDNLNNEEIELNKLKNFDI